MLEAVENYFNKLKTTIDNLNRKEIEIFIEKLLIAQENGNNIFIMGNGGSATTAGHFCCDFNKSVSEKTNGKRFKFICLNDNIATMLAYANDISYEDIFVEQLKNFLQPNDIVIAISGSGNSKNIIKAVEYANDNNAITIGLTGFDGGKLKKIAHHSINTNLDDMRISEDIHLIIAHVVSETLEKTWGNK